MKKSAIVLATLLAASTTASADQYRAPRNEIRAWRSQKDMLLVESVVDARNLDDVRRFVRITDGGQVVAEIPNAGFDVLAASPDESLFVGLSNSGEDPTAVVVFDRKGRIALQVAEGIALFNYCSRSVTYVREWHGSQPSDVHFEEGNFLPAIWLTDCRGRRLNLLETVGNAIARYSRECRALKAYR
jgi:hypothetical protein